jgi:phage-related protein
MATLYDLLGKKIYEVQLGQTPLNTISTSEIKTGIYLLNIRYQGGTFTQKIPVNK